MKDQHIDPEALAELHPMAWPWALHLTGGDREFAQDVLQSAYLTILEGRARWKGQSAFKTWVFGVIRLTCKSQVRKRGLLSFRFPGTSQETMEALAPVETLRDPMSKSMQRIILSLPKKQAETVALIFGQDFTVEEAAEIMGVGVGTARTHYARAKSTLRTRLCEINGAATDD